MLVRLGYFYVGHATLAAKLPMLRVLRKSVKVELVTIFFFPQRF
jgi:hypothetical protein